MKYVFVILLNIFIALSLFAFGSQEQMEDSKQLPQEEPPQNTVKILGMIQIYGNEPHTFVGIQGEDGEEYAVYSPSNENELRKLQGHLIEFTVIFTEEEQSFGSLFLKSGTVKPVSWRIIR